MLVLFLLSMLGCRAAGTPVNTPPRQPAGPPGGGAPAEEARPAPAPVKKIPPERRVWAYMDGQRRLMDMDEARSYGLTLVDLSDDWVPYIFWSKTPGQEDQSFNAYSKTYVDLANDRVDVDGFKLSKRERNYLEVYGIPASLSVLRRRFLQDEEKACYKELDFEVFSEYHGAIRVADPSTSKAEANRYYGARTNFKRALKKARVRTLEQLLQKKRYAGVAKRWQRYSWRHKAIRQMQKRMVCDEMFNSRKPRIRPGVVTWATRQALRRFERKHNVFGWGMMFENTVKALGWGPREANYQSLRRVLTERVVTAARILEDGTTRGTYKDESGKIQKVRDLVKEFSEAILTQMGLTDADKALEFIKAHTEQDFSRFWVAVRLPKLPEYYSDNMDFKVIIDRGDVWYDFPNKFNAHGRLVPKPRSRFPNLTLYVNHGNDKIPLVRWRTTVGSWQPELRHGEEYYKYKISDVGPRIWKHIVAGPVWVPPRNTPSSDLVKRRLVRGRSERIVAHNSFGPGYASAYGLVAAFHVTESGNDNQVRTHGSANYMSISSSNGFSHGCHRLRNFRAVRLFSFVLSHRPFKRKGQSKLKYRPRFEHLGEEFQMDLRTRGYYYEMTPPVPVNVLEGNIRGNKQQPIEDYVKKPTKIYQEDLRPLKQKTPAGAPRIKKKDNGGMMKQEQIL